MTQQNDQLHAAIMNLPCEVPDTLNGSQAYDFKCGHKQARHAAAELVVASPQPAIPQGVSDERIHELATEAGFGFFGKWMLYQGNRAELIAFARALLSPAPEAREATALRTTLDLTLTNLELCDLAAFATLDQADADEAVRLMVGDGHSGYGLYAAAPDYPDEGAVFVKSLAAPEQAAQDSRDAGSVLDALEVLRRMGLAYSSTIDASQFLRLLGERGMWVIENPLSPTQQTSEQSGGSNG